MVAVDAVDEGEAPARQAMLPPISTQNSNLFDWEGEGDKKAMMRRYRRSNIVLPNALDPSGGSSASMPQLPSLHGRSGHNFAGPAKVLHPQNTVQKWRSYRKLAEAHKRPLERGARWRSETKILEQANCREADKNSTFRPGAASWAADAHCAHARSRDRLRRQLRDANESLDMREKRGWVPGLVASEDVSHHRADEQRKVASSMLRIEGAIRDCSQRRLELVAMQKSMAAVVYDKPPPPERDASKKKARAPSNHLLH